MARWPYGDPDEAIWAEPDMPALDVEYSPPQTIGIILDHHGHILTTVHAPRPPIGFTRS